MWCLPYGVGPWEAWRKTGEHFSSHDSCFSGCLWSTAALCQSSSWQRQPLAMLKPVDDCQIFKHEVKTAQYLTPQAVKKWDRFNWDAGKHRWWVGKGDLMGEYQWLDSRFGLLTLLPTAWMGYWKNKETTEISNRQARTLFKHTHSNKNNRVACRAAKYTLSQSTDTMPPSPTNLGRV